VRQGSDRAPKIYRCRVRVPAREQIDERDFLERFLGDSLRSDRLRELRLELLDADRLK
jgi:hypothetical protein